jgi:ketosteroid isomerase-like protein
VDPARRKQLEDGYAAINSGDVDRALGQVARDIEIVTSGAFLDEGAVYRGHEGVREFLEMVNESFDGLLYEPLELIELDDGRVLSLVRVTGRGRGSGVEVEMDAGHVWTLRGDKAVRLEAFADPESARAAAGLAPG